MANKPGPYELRFLYTTTASSVVHNHSHRLNIQLSGDPEPGADFDTYVAVGRDLTAWDLDDFVNAYFALLDDLFHTSADFPSVELWSYEFGTFDATFLSVYALADNGASASAAQLDGQSIITFRSSGGGIMKVSLMEGIAVPGNYQAFPTSSTPVNDYAAFICGVASPILARDNGFPIAPLHYLPGSNERLTKKRTRP